jgi:hypothetical protein
MNRILKTAVPITLLLLLLSFDLARSRGESDARAIGMGGAYTALARDLDAPSWNPANLGLSDGKSFSLNMLNVGLKFKNNSFSLDDYNRYNGKFLTDSDKEEIINSIPVDGLSLDLGAEASTMNFSVGNFAVTYKGLGVSSFTLDRDPFILMLLGNAVLRDLSIRDTRGEAYALGDAALSYGQAIRRWDGGEMCVGASVHYLRGLAYEKVAEAEGGVSTTDTGFVGSGQMILRSSLGGQGYATDMGLAIRFEDSWFFSAVWQNMAGKMIWNHKNEDYLMKFNMRPVTVNDLTDENLRDSLVTSSDTTYDIGTFSSKLTPAFRLGLSRTFRKVIISMDWEQNLFNGPGVGVNPRLATGVEYSPCKQLPLRTGLAFGGAQGTIYSLGFGVKTGRVTFDLGAANSGAISPNHTKGARMAIGMAMRF